MLTGVNAQLVAGGAIVQWPPVPSLTAIVPVGLPAPGATTDNVTEPPSAIAAIAPPASGESYFLPIVASQASAKIGTQPRPRMAGIDRRQFLAASLSLGIAAIWSRANGSPSRTKWREQRDVFREGVASGDPTPDSVILWTRYSDHGKKPASLIVELAEDEGFAHVVATKRIRVAEDADWTCRVLVGGLKAAREYWYRFCDDIGQGSRIGRTVTAPAPDDPRPVRFAFVSCQNVNLREQTAYRRMIYEDRRARPEDRLGFVLHLGDFVYELVWTQQDRPKGYYGRAVRDLPPYPHGEKIDDFHIPTTVEDYRTLYRAYLADPDLQDARAWFPFVPIWDNHEFSWLGWQSFQVFDGKTMPRQTRKVAAMQAWFEYLPARVKKPSATLERFDPPRVHDAAIGHFDENGLGQEPNNLAALASLTGYRSLRWGKHVDLMITDQRSYRSEDPGSDDRTDQFMSKDYPGFFPDEVLEIIDAGKAANNGHPPATLRFGDKEFDNWRKAMPPQTILGVMQRAWFLDRLKHSDATWKIWGNTMGTLDNRVDPQNVPEELAPKWPGAGYANFGGGDHSGAFFERALIYDFVAREKITGFVTVAGDRHSFWAGLAAKALPPKKFEPVGIAFVTGSISAPGAVASYEYKFKKNPPPLQALFLADRNGTPEPTINMLLLHGVRSCLEYAKSGDAKKAKALSNPENAPHLRFVDMDGHGYSVVSAAGDALAVEFICIPRPLEPNAAPDGGPLRYRVVHRTPAWKAGEIPQIAQRIVEGDPELST